MKEFKAYQCDFCSKYGKQKSRIKKHEELCFRNPKSKSCATCANLFQRKYMHKAYTGYEAPFGEGLESYSESIPECLEGVEVSFFIENEKIVKLKTKCPLWDEKQLDVFLN